MKPDQKPPMMVYVANQQYGEKPFPYMFDALKYGMAITSQQPGDTVVEYVRPRRWKGVLPAWRRLRKRYPFIAGFGLGAMVTSSPLAVLVSCLRISSGHTHDWGWATLFTGLTMVSVIGTLWVTMILIELLDADRAMRVRFKLRTGEDYDADPFA